MNNFIRVLTVLLSVGEGVGWSVITFGIWSFGNSLRGMGDGAGTESGGSGMLGVLLIAVIWLIPTSPYILLVCNSFNLIPGNKLRRTAQIYSYFVLAIMSLIELRILHGRLAPLVLGNVAAVALWIWHTRKASEKPEASTV